MSDYGNEQQNEIMRSIDALPDFGWPLSGWNPFPDLSLFRVSAGRYFIIGLLPGLAVLFGALAYFQESHSYWNLLCLELSGGCLFFALTPIIVRRARLHGWQVRLTGLSIAVPLLALAYYCHELLPQLSEHDAEFLSAALIEYSGALLLMIGLEVTMTPWLEALKKREDTIRADYAKVARWEKKLQDWRDALARGEMDTPYPDPGE